MNLISGRTRMSSRGQVVIPKALREAAGFSEGDELEVVFDGDKLTLALRGRGAGPVPDEPLTGELVAETRSSYAAVDRAAARQPDDRVRPSKVWADRLRALAAIKRLSVEFGGVKFEELRAESRRELEDGERHE